MIFGKTKMEFKVGVFVFCGLVLAGMAGRTLGGI